MVSRTGSVVVVKCTLETHDGSQEVQRLRTAGPLKWEALQAILEAAFGPAVGPVAYKYKDDEGDWCTLRATTFEDFLFVNDKALQTSECPVVKLQVHRGGQSYAAPDTGGDVVLLPVPDSVMLAPADACGPKPFLTALRHLSHGCAGGWTAENVCTLALAFLPTLEQRALRKAEKMNRMGPVLVATLRKPLELLQTSFEHQPKLDKVPAQLLAEILAGRQSGQLGSFVVAVMRSMRALPFPQQKVLLMPMLGALLQARPSLFMEIFGEANEVLGLEPAIDVEMVELPSGRQVPRSRVLVPENLALEQKVHLACLGFRSVPQGGWANLRISADGKLGVGACGKFATFTVTAKCETDGVHQVMLKSDGGGGYLRYDGAGGFCSGLAGPEAMLSLKPLGPKGAGDNKALAFALISELGGAVAVRTGAVGILFGIPESQLHDEDDSGAFFIIQSGMADGDKHGPRQASKLAKEDAQQGRSEKHAGRSMKATEQEAKKTAKRAEHAAMQVKKTEKHQQKECVKREKRSAKFAAKLGAKDIVPVAMLSEVSVGTVVFLEDTATFGRIRIRQDGGVDTKGGYGPWATFVVHVKENGMDGLADRKVIALQSQPKPERYLRLPVGKTLAFENLAGDGTGLGQEGCVFELVDAGGGDNDRAHVFELRPEGAKDGQSVRLYMKWPTVRSEQELDNL